MTDYITDAQNDVQTYFETHDIPTHFYQCLFGELVKIWGIRLIMPDENCGAIYDDEDNTPYSYKDQIACYLSAQNGTWGWTIAFKEACTQCDLAWLAQDYDGFDWVRGDIFDGYIIEKLIDVVFEGNTTNDYYLFKVSKGDPQ